MTSKSEPQELAAMVAFHDSLERADPVMQDIVRAVHGYELGDVVTALAVCVACAIDDYADPEALTIEHFAAIVETVRQVNARGLKA